MLIGIVDYGLGNVKSVTSAIEYLGHESIMVQTKYDFEKVSHIILPGVGSFERGMKLIHQKKLFEVLNNQVLIKKKPTLGICLGLQLMAEIGHEFGFHNGLSWIGGQVIELPKINEKRELPNIGWESVNFKQDQLFEGIHQNADFYFVHSYYLKNTDNNFSIASYSIGNHKITAAVRNENIVATQFHPEKSQDSGLILLSNFLKM